jgi:iron-sulfur cluster assembly accessory protein
LKGRRLKANDMIEITQSAARIIRRQLDKQQKPGGGLRIAVKAGGCSGFSYTFAWDDAARDTDEVFEGADGAKVFVDPRSLKLLDGTVLDFDEHNLLATGFTLKNPHAKSTCGCGESFSA